MKKAFSLVELSIVLVILGLLVGGILAGQSLIRASELRSVSVEQGKFVTTMGAFRDKYFAIPGDFKLATSFWPAAAACPGISSTAAAGVCNGDGNGSLWGGSATSNEVFGFWEHLAYAGLVEGTYSGNPNTNTVTDETTLIGTNVPRSKVNNAGWTAYYPGDSVPVSGTIWFDGVYSNALVFGAQASSWMTLAAALKPEEAWNIDTKMDDGRPALGKVRTLESQGSGACSDLAGSTTVSLGAAVYQLSNTAIACSFIMQTGY